ncbi:MAG: pteridine reductase [Gammaproteobacteria bacterium]|nr:pteridine reductase [Gammaproteobacteria bacterium]NNM21254.1 pteridine reductase [Gammaproteobacteria bacterium]
MDNKVVLITGAARRIGAAIAACLHDAGARVVVHYNQSADDAESLVAGFNAKRDNSALALQADIRDFARLPDLVEKTVNRFGQLDALVNNASTFYPTPVGNIDTGDWEDLLGTNLGAPLFLSQAAAPRLRESRGAIVNLVDIHAKRPLHEHPVYCAAKAGLDMLTRSLARELGPDIRVNGVAPGPILWPEQGVDDDAQEKIIAATALKRTGDPDDIAATVLFLLRDAGFITGQIIAVDGGRSI